MDRVLHHFWAWLARRVRDRVYPCGGTRHRVCATCITPDWCLRERSDA